MFRMEVSFQPRLDIHAKSKYKAVPSKTRKYAPPSQTKSKLSIFGDVHSNLPPHERRVPVHVGVVEVYM